MLRYEIKDIEDAVYTFFGIILFILLVPVIFFLRWAHGDGREDSWQT